MRRHAVYLAAQAGKTNIIKAVLEMLDELREVNIWSEMEETLEKRRSSE